MNARAVTEEALRTFEPGQLIFASKLYQTKLSNHISEAAYYKTLQRLCDSKKLSTVSRGIYCIPKHTKYGVILPSEQEIVNEFTSNASGTVVGYSMYNSLQLTTQVGKGTSVYSSKIDKKTKSIGNVILTYHPIKYSKEVTEMIHMLEVLQNYYEIQDMNQVRFLALCQTFSKSYNEEVFKYVHQHIGYQKRAISFLREILNYHGVPNGLSEYLSSLSTYNHPKMEALYEATRIRNGVS